MNLMPFSVVILMITVAFPPTGVADGLRLDTAEISDLYFEGEFAEVIEKLEAFRKSTPEPTFTEKIFTYKYLSVVYAANPDTRPKAESYMVQLLKLTPTIELLDMYVSDNIQVIFRKVKEDFQRRKEYKQSYDPLGLPIAKSEPESEKNGKKPKIAEADRKAWLWWTAGGAALAAAIVAYVLLSAEGDSEGYRVEGSI